MRSPQVTTGWKTDWTAWFLRWLKFLEEHDNFWEPDPPASALDVWEADYNAKRAEFLSFGGKSNVPKSEPDAPPTVPWGLVLGGLAMVTVAAGAVAYAASETRGAVRESRRRERENPRRRRHRRAA